MLIKLGNFFTLQTGDTIVENTPKLTKAEALEKARQAKLDKINKAYDKKIAKKAPTKPLELVAETLEGVAQKLDAKLDDMADKRTTRRKAVTKEHTNG